MLRSISLLALVGLSLVVLSIPLELFNRSSVADRYQEEGIRAIVNEKLTSSLVQKINKNRPEVLLIGNSMLGEAVDADRLSKLTGIPCLKVWTGGAASAWWYLLIKNVVPLMAPPPKYIVVFFRDNFLTLPQYRTKGKRKEWIDDLSGPYEPLLYDLAYSKQLSIFELMIIKAFPVYARTEEVKKTMETYLKKTVAAVFFQSDEDMLNEALKITFDEKRMDKELFSQRQISDENSAGSNTKSMIFTPEESFLPAMIKHSETLGVHLSFVRIKRRRDLEPGKQPEDLVNYIDELKVYLAEQKLELIDYTDNESIIEEHYGGGDHLNRQNGRKFFTALLAKDLLEKIILK